jgi:hypothetical protein
MTLGYHAFDTWWWPYVFIALAGIAANEVWRILGVVLSGRLSETSEAFVIVKAIASALVAGVISEVVMFPSGALAAVPLVVRLGSVALGLGVFLVTRRNLGLGILTGEAAFLAGVWLFA